MRDTTTVFVAEWVLPVVTPPVRGGWVAVRGGRVVALGALHDLDSALTSVATPDGVRPVRVDLGRVAVLPGLVNAHTHLELSWMRGRVGPDTSMPQWAGRLMSLRAQAGGDDPAAIAPAIAEMYASGTAVVGDVGNTLAARAPLGRGPLAGVSFREVIGFRPDDPVGLAERALEELAASDPPAGVRLSVAAHAPYSVHPEIFARFGQARRDGRARPVAVHLGESAEEVEFLQTGGGAWRAVLEQVGAWNGAWRPPGGSPVDYLARLGFLGPGCLAVHGVQLDLAELRRLAALEVTLVTCPRSNQWTGAGLPPVSWFYESGVRVAVGTDSAASADDLNMFAELAELHRLAPEVPPARLLQSATLDGAEALGLAADYGAIAPGRRAALIAVDLSARGADDVEDQLCSGIGPDAITWLDAASSASG